MTRMRLATNNRWRNAEGIPQESVEFHTVIAFGKLAETASLYCTRGLRIYIEGRMRTRQYEAADGARRTSTEVIADTLRLIGARADGKRADADSAEPGDAEFTGTGDDDIALTPTLTVTG